MRARGANVGYVEGERRDDTPRSPPAHVSSSRERSARRGELLIGGLYANDERITKN